MQDDSWTIEVREFIDDIENQTLKSENLVDTMKVMTLIREIYARSSG